MHVNRLSSCAKRVSVAQHSANLITCVPNDARNLNCFGTLVAIGGSFGRDFIGFHELSWAFMGLCDGI